MRIPVVHTRELLPHRNLLAEELAQRLPPVLSNTIHKKPLRLNMGLDALRMPAKDIRRPTAELLERARPAKEAADRLLHGEPSAVPDDGPDALEEEVHKGTKQRHQDLGVKAGEPRVEVALREDDLGIRVGVGELQRPEAREVRHGVVHAEQLVPVLAGEGFWGWRLIWGVDLGPGCYGRALEEDPVGGLGPGVEAVEDVLESELGESHCEAACACAKHAHTEDFGRAGVASLFFGRGHVGELVT